MNERPCGSDPFCWAALHALSRVGQVGGRMTRQCQEGHARPARKAGRGSCTGGSVSYSLGMVRIGGWPRPGLRDPAATGMALEPANLGAAMVKTEYVCPMHPEIVRDTPGACPICGMSLEPRTVTLADEVNPELRDMMRRFWVSAALAVPVLLLAMSDMIPGQPVQRALPSPLMLWAQLVLSTPAVL